MVRKSTIVPWMNDVFLISQVEVRLWRMRYPTLMSTVEGVYLTNATKAWMLPQAASTLKLYIDSWLMSRFSFDVLQGLCAR